MTELLSFGVATHQAQRAEIFALRERVYQSLKWDHLLLQSLSLPSPASDAIDKDAFLFFLAVDSTIIATCRAVPLVSHPLFLTRLCTLQPALNVAQGVVIERLVLDESHRDNITYKKLLATGCRWLQQHSKHTVWYAKCSQILTRLYSRFEAQVIGRERERMPNQKPRIYQYLQGEIASTLACTENFILPMTRNQVRVAA